MAAGPLMRPQRRALILLVVLVMIVLLALLAASYSFLVRAHVGSVMAGSARFQARMAAESGIQRAIAVLRQARNNPGVWFNNPALFGGQVVYSMHEDEAGLANFEDEKAAGTGGVVWRFSLMGRDFDNPNTVRYGLTDECSKLDINRASEGQLRRFFWSPWTLPQDTRRPVNRDVLVDSLLDWREPGDAPRPNGAKDEYYSRLRPAYFCKKAPFSTVEELLLVRGFSAWVLFGEDFNRNGLLDPNEDDGDRSFPPDDGDGVLFGGVAPYLTIWSTEMNVSSDGRSRIRLNDPDRQNLQEALIAENLDSSITDYILANAGRFTSVMNLFDAGAPPPPPEQEQNPPDVPPLETSQPSSSTEHQQGALDNTAGTPSSDLEQAPGSSENRTATSQPACQLSTAQPPPVSDPRVLAVLLDRLTFWPNPLFQGRINISTAPAPVLAALEELTEAEVEAIVTVRRAVKPEELATPAWLLTHGVLDPHKLCQLLDADNGHGRITTGSSVFTVDAVGYADHVGLVERIQAVIEMRGPVGQIVYYRNLSPLGVAYQARTVELRGPVSRTEQ